MTNYLKENERFLQLFDEWRSKAGHKSDAAAAAELAIPRQTMHNYRKGHSKPDVYACTRLALACRYDPITLIAELECAKETTGPRATFWRDFVRAATSHGGTAALIFGMLSPVASNPSDANTNDRNITRHYTHWWRPNYTASLRLVGRVLRWWCLKQAQV